MTQILARKKIKALSLIEVIVYLAIFAVIFTAIVLFVIGVRDTNQRSEMHNQLYKSVLFMTHNLNEKSSTASAIVLDQSILNDDNGKIVMVLDGNNVSFERLNNKLYFTAGGVSTNLTDAEITVNKFN